MKKQIVVGEWKIKRTEWYDKPMPNHESAQCGLLVFDDCITLKSYSTIVADYYPKSRAYCCLGTYTATTRKHLGWFAKYINDTYGENLNYYNFKDAAEKHYGELVYIGD